MTEEERELLRTPPLTARKQRASTQSEPEPETPTKRPTGRFNSDKSLSCWKYDHCLLAHSINARDTPILYIVSLMPTSECQASFILFFCKYQEVMSPDA